MSHPNKCPECDTSWDSELSIPEELMLMDPEYYDTWEKATEAASYYGWTADNNRAFAAANVIGIEVEGYDGVSYWHCTECGAYNKRFPWVKDYV